MGSDTIHGTAHDFHEAVAAAEVQVDALYALILRASDWVVGDDPTLVSRMSAVTMKVAALVEEMHGIKGDS